MDEPNVSGGATTEAQTGAGEQPSEQDRSEIDQRAAYEAELNRITSVDMILQTTVSLINIGGRRLGLTAPGAAPAESQRDMEQVRDAIDGARALMPILERHMSGELGPMRDAIAQLQMAYAREAQAAPAAPVAPTAPAAAQAASTSPQAPPASEKEGPATPDGESQKGPGPAQASGRLWVPGR